MKKFKVLLISIFILFNFMMMIRAQIDDRAPLTSFIFKPVTFVQNYLSMWRGWNMFAPNPLRSNSYVDAKVTFNDGSSFIWNFSISKSTSPLKHYLYGERLRKYSVDGLRLDHNSHLWQDAARFVLRKIATTHYKKIPIKVTLRRRWKDIPDWNEYFISHKDSEKKEYKKFDYYTYEVFSATAKN